MPDHLYTRVLPSLEELEQERLQLVKKVKNLQYACLAGTSLPASLSLLFGIPLGLPLAAGAGLALYTYLYRRLTRSFRLGFKERILARVVTGMGPEYAYDHQGRIEEEALLASGLFPSVQSVECEDLVTRASPEYDYRMAEVRLWKRTASVRRKDGEDPARYEMFRGLFLDGTVPRPAPSDIWILSWRAPERWDMGRIGADWRLVKVNHEAFEREYRVYATVPVAARAFLTDALLDAIARLDRDLADADSRLELALRGRKVFASLSRTDDLFEPPVETPVTDVDHFTRHYRYLEDADRLIRLFAEHRPA